VDVVVDRCIEGTVEILVSDTNDLWKRCADALREQVSDATWRTWLQGLVPAAFDGDLLVLTAPSTVVRERVENRFLGLICAAASDVATRDVKVRVEVAPMPVVTSPLPQNGFDEEPVTRTTQATPGAGGGRRGTSVNDRDG